MKEKWADKLVKRLEGHTMEPPEGLWEGIADGIGHGKKPQKKIAMVIAGAMTAAAMVVGGLLLLNRDKVMTPQEIIAVNDSINRQVEQTALPYTIIEPDNTIAQSVMHHPSTAQDVAPSIETTTDSTDHHIQATPKTEPINAQENTKEEKQTARPRQEYASTGTIDMRQKSKRENRLTMGLAFAGGVGGSGTDHYKSYRTYYNPNLYGGYGDGDFNYGSTYSGTSGKTNIINQTANHRLPMRVGLNIGYQIDRRWSVESGLSYTYLYSDLSEGEENVIIYTKQRLHYLGIPVALKYNILSGKALKVYATGGGMIEKSVKGTSDVTTEINGETTFENTKSLNEKPLQLSVNAALGTEYEFTNGVSAYLEPSLGYYFKDNTPLVHYYKDHPLAPAIKVGVRINVNGK